MIEEFKNWLKQNITKDCNSNDAYEKCKNYITEVSHTAND